jgi:chromate transporter
MTEDAPDERQQPSYLQIFLAFLKLGLTAFGGPAMVAYIGKLAVDERRWVDKASFADGVALCQGLPGATAMQVAAYVGLRMRGVAGALASYIGFGLPAFCLMLVLSAIYVQTHQLAIALSIFAGLQVLVVALIATAILSFGRTTITSGKAVTIVTTATVLFLLRVHPVFVILLAAVLGVIFMPNAIPETSASYRRLPATAKIVLAIIILAAGTCGGLFLVRPDLFSLIAAMIQVDLLAFGGGYSSLPLMFHQVVDTHAWLDTSTFLNGIALGQITPGPIVITATFVGYLVAGVPGAVVATMGIFLPSFLLVVGTAPYFDRIRDSPRISRALQGIVCSFVGLLVSVLILLAMPIPWGAIRVILAVGAFIALVRKVSVIWVVLAAAGIGLLLL